MLKVEQQGKRLTPLRLITPGSLAKRYELADLISNSPAEFFTEAQLELFVIASKLSVSDALPLRVDLLALDTEGRGVIVVTRNESKHADLATPIACAAMIAQWTPQQFLEQLSVERREALKSFLHSGVDSINGEQSVILVAEDYNDKELTAVNWLRDRHDIDIRCLCIVTAVDSEQNAYFSVTKKSPAAHPTVAVHSELDQSSSVSLEMSSPRLAAWASS